MIADDLFAGAGGWDLAAEQLGIHARGVENMPQARATRDAASLTTIHDDVWTFAPDGAAQGLIASPPCQTFSQAGKGAGRKALDDVLTVLNSLDVYRLDRLRAAGARFGDDRTALVLTPLHFALTNPAYRWLAWEQVPTVLPVWEACAERLRAFGWNVWTGLLHAEQYGVPQTRKRAFLLASRDEIVTPPTATHSRYYPRSPEKLDPGVEKWVSMAEALGWCCFCAWEPRDVRMVSNYGSGGDPANRGIRTFDQPAPTVTSKIDRNIVFCGAGGTAELTAGQVPRTPDQPAHTITGAGTAAWREPLPDWQARNSGPGAARRPRSLDEPSYTIRAQGSGSHPSGVEWLRGDRRPTSSVRVTVAEASVLQSFPADYPWQGAKGKQYLQCGNAIPPGLALAALSAAVGAQASIEGISA